MRLKLALHPFFIAAYPVFFLLSQNISQIPLDQIWRPLFITLAVGSVLLIIFSIASKNIYHGAVTTSLLLLLFFSYGHVYRWLSENTPSLASHTFLGFLWLALLSLGMFLKWKAKNILFLTNQLNIVTGVLLVLPLFTISQFFINSGTKNVEVSSKATNNVHPQTSLSEEDTPDIYYIIVDSYGSSDILNELFEYDNSAFLNELQGKGFFIASKSHSNYVQTTLSLSSSLNMEYINYLTDELGENSTNRAPLTNLIHHSQVQSLLTEQGYQTVAFATPYGPTNLADADVFFAYQPSFFNDLEGLLVSSSAFSALDIPLNNLPLNCDAYRGSVLHVFDSLTKVPAMTGKQFVFAHIDSPHHPFIFDENGNPVEYGPCYGSTFRGTREQYRTGYAKQATFISQMLLETVLEILEESDPAPIIIIQGDHGSSLLLDWDSSSNSCLRERTAILNAYYFPDMDNHGLYDTITPVNSFRIVLNSYFGTELPILEDKIFFSSLHSPYQFNNITNKIETTCDKPSQ